MARVGPQRHRKKKLDGCVGGQRHALAALPPGKRPDSHCIGGWVGPIVSLDGCGKSRPHRDSVPDRPARSELLYRQNYPGPLNVMLYGR